MLTENGSVVVVGSGTGTNNTLVKWLNGGAGTLDDSTVLSENAFGALVANGKFVSSTNGAMQIDFGAGAYLLISTDTGALVTPYMLLDPPKRSANFFAGNKQVGLDDNGGVGDGVYLSDSLIGFIGVSNIVSGTPRVQLGTAGLTLVAPVINIGTAGNIIKVAGLSAYASDAAAGVAGLVTGDLWRQDDGAGGFNLKVKA